MIRRYLAEFIGTFVIVFFGCGAIITQHGDPLMVNLAFGFTIAAAIYALGHISAAHFNPAVTIGFATGGRFPWRFVAPYIISQLLGATFASFLHRFLLGQHASDVSFGATVPTVTSGNLVVTEAILTFFLMLTIISVATDKRANGAVPGIAIGMMVAVCGLFGGPLTGSSMNVARSLGPALFSSGKVLSYVPFYALGSVLGAVIAALTYEAMRGGSEHASSAPNDIGDALDDIESAMPGNGEAKQGG
jgi:MIP family channel proteins